MSAVFSPGSYIAARRQAASLSIDDVAERVSVEPHVSAIARRAWIALIEADVAPISADVIRALRPVFPFDREVLEHLIDLQAGVADLPAPRLCRICACSENCACIEWSAGRPMACSWVAEDLCSACGASAAAPPPSSSACVPASPPPGAVA